jgi:hypothetical protein
MANGDWKLGKELEPHFSVLIRLGNEGMSSRANIADALITVAGKVRNGPDFGLVHDPNGNKVGSFMKVFK